MGWGRGVGPIRHSMSAANQARGRMAVAVLLSAVAVGGVGGCSMVSKTASASWKKIKQLKPPKPVDPVESDLAYDRPRMRRGDRAEAWESRAEAAGPGTAFGGGTAAEVAAPAEPAFEPWVESPPPTQPATPATPGASPFASPFAAQPVAMANAPVSVESASPLARMLGRAGAAPAAQTKEPRRVTTTLDGRDFDPDVAPDGDWLVYASTRHGQSSDIYRKRLDGQSITQLTADPANDAMPCVSPDGRYIAFASDRSGNWDIYVMSIDGGRAVQITDDPGQDVHPSFSPDGGRLVYCTRPEKGGAWEIVLVDLQRPAAKTHLCEGLLPSWSPRGETLLFQRASGRGERLFGVWSVDLENGQAVRPTELASAGNAACITPDWSADGERVVFCTLPSGGTDSQGADVWVMAADGSGRRRVTDGRHATRQPTFAPDGTILFVANHDGAENVFVIEVEK